MLVLLGVGRNGFLHISDVEPQYFRQGGYDPEEIKRESDEMAEAAAKPYEKLLANHKADYTELYDRVSLDLAATEPAICTDDLVDAYPAGASSRYLEELAFQFGRYMLICSSRTGTLPPHLQGIWNVYSDPPWASQYLHDTNLQMAYAPAFCTNMPELFECYIGYFNAYVPRQRLYATEFVEQFNPSQLDPDGDNGWSGPFWTNPYHVPGRSIVAPPHSCVATNSRPAPWGPRSRPSGPPA